MPHMPVVAVILALQTSQSPPPTTPSATTAVAQRAKKPPVIDGKDDDEVWRVAPVIRDFRQFQPTEDGNPTLPTEAKVAYDAHNFYVFVRAFDNHPDSIKKLLARRDVRICCDQIKIVIDSYHDRRTGFEFAVNPGGVKRDYAAYGDDQQEDDAWDGVWEVATQVDSLGWTAEFRIPLSQLRYAHKPSNIFGFAIWRDIDRHGRERVGWPLYRYSRRGFISQLGDVVGLEGLEAPRRLELSPYAVAKNLPAPGFERDQKFDGGADIKYGITSNITVDATVNPDFGQVEADPSVVNLSSFETFFQERRPFFVEGTGIFSFSVSCNIVNCRRGQGLFYSRRIGHDPSRIIGAAKITGRLPGGLTIGAVEGVTKRASQSGATIEPVTNYGVVRLQQDFRNGQSGIGFMATGVNRNIDQFTEAGLRRNAYVGAVDFRHRFAKGTYELSGSFDLSRVSGSPSAIAFTQRSSVHNYQRPDDDLRFDSTRTSLGGDVEELLFTRRSGLIQFQTSYQRISPGFEINDLGFLRRADQQGWNNWGSLNWPSRTKAFNRAAWNFNWWQFWTTGGLPTDRGFNTNAFAQLKNLWFVNGSVTIGQLGAVYCDRCARGGPAVRMSRFVAPSIGLQGDDRRVVVPFLFFNYFKGDEGRSSSVAVSPEIDVRIGSQFRSSISGDISHNIADAQDLNPRTDSVGTHYLFAHLNQQTLGISFRIDYTATPTLTVQVYAQPFVSKGQWSNLRELSSTPRAAAYVDRFQPFAGASPGDFNLKFFNSNFVIRWEYRPGSTLYLVWSQGRFDSEPTMGTRNFAGDFGRLFNSYPSNTFLIKASYWINR